jgi:hypothetical protein
MRLSVFTTEKKCISLSLSLSLFTRPKDLDNAPIHSQRVIKKKMCRSPSDSLSQRDTPSDTLGHSVAGSLSQTVATLSLFLWGKKCAFLPQDSLYSRLSLKPSLADSLSQTLATLCLSLCECCLTLRVIDNSTH